MTTPLRTLLVPESQRRTWEELSEDLDLTTGDSPAKRSAFWTMLVLSAVIASAGVLADSTATVIGAMIIAPLSTPIMGIALGLVRNQRTRSLRYVVSGSLLVITIGTLFGLLLPSGYVLLDNSQIAGRTSPGLSDVIAAIATGLAGAVALARRDVAAILPGVAIAISLVPPLAVVGYCVGRGELEPALGAALLFLSNLLALVAAGTFVFAVLASAVSTSAAGWGPGGRGRAYLTLAGLGVLVLVPLVANTVLAFVTTTWEARIETAANEWLSGVDGAVVEEVDHHALTFYVRVSTPQELPPTDRLLTGLEGRVPDGLSIVVDATQGRRVEAGRVGS